MSAPKLKAPAAAQSQIRRRLIALRQAASILQRAGFAVHTCYFVGQYMLKSTDCAPDQVVLLRPVGQAHKFSGPKVDRGSSRKLNRKGAKAQSQKGGGK